MNIYNMEVHRESGFYIGPDAASIKVIDSRNDKEVTFYEEKVTFSRLVFVLEGKVKLKINKRDVQVVTPGYVALAPGNSSMIASVDPKTYLLVVNFTEKEPFCTRYSLVSLMHDVKLTDDDVSSGTLLPINERLQSFVDSTLACLEDGLYSNVYITAKKQELFLLMLAYYTKEELAAFFSPLFCYNRKFEQMVIENYGAITDVKQFAALLNMPVTTFQRKFKKYFKTSVKQWLLDRKAEQMLNDIRNTNRSITDLSQRYDFSSVSYFSNFCKHYFGKTPTELRAENNTKDAD